MKTLVASRWRKFLDGLFGRHAVDFCDFRGLRLNAFGEGFAEEESDAFGGEDLVVHAMVICTWLD